MKLLNMYQSWPGAIVDESARQIEHGSYIQALLPLLRSLTYMIFVELLSSFSDLNFSNHECCVLILWHPTDVGKMTKVCALCVTESVVPTTYKTRLLRASWTSSSPSSIWLKDGDYDSYHFHRHPPSSESRKKPFYCSTPFTSSLFSLHNQVKLV